MEIKEKENLKGFSFYLTRLIKILYKDGQQISTAKGVLIEIFEEEGKKFLKIKHPKKEIPITVKASEIDKIEPWGGEE